MLRVTCRVVFADKDGDLNSLEMGGDSDLIGTPLLCSDLDALGEKTGKAHYGSFYWEQGMGKLRGERWRSSGGSLRQSGASCSSTNSGPQGESLSQYRGAHVDAAGQGGTSLSFRMSSGANLNARAFTATAGCRQ